MPAKRDRADEVLLMALACGATVIEAATKAGIGLRTAHRRLEDPEFVKRLEDLKADMMKRAASMLTAAGMAAVRTLVSLQEAGNPPAVRLGAAKATLELGLRIRETVELEERIKALESQLPGNKLPGNIAA